MAHTRSAIIQLHFILLINPKALTLKGTEVPTILLLLMLLTLAIHLINKAMSVQLLMKKASIIRNMIHIVLLLLVNLSIPLIGVHLLVTHVRVERKVELLVQAVAHPVHHHKPQESLMVLLVFNMDFLVKLHQVKQASIHSFLHQCIRSPVAVIVGEANRRLTGFCFFCFR